MKIVAVGVELFRADGRTVGHDETNSRFSRFCERAWKWILEEIRWSGLFGSGEGKMKGFCEHGEETWCCLKCPEFVLLAEKLTIF
jgi:hypothetical protein